MDGLIPMITKRRCDGQLILKIDDAAHLYALYPAWDRSVMIICDLQTKKEWRRRGYASALLKRAIWEARRNNCKVIQLEDCSDYFNLPGNIYIKHGFNYSEHPPTMVLYLNHPSNKDTGHSHPTDDDSHYNEPAHSYQH